MLLQIAKRWPAERVNVAMLPRPSNCWKLSSRVQPIAKFSRSGAPDCIISLFESTISPPSFNV